MATDTLRDLIGEAMQLARADPCEVTGHLWESEGGRGCPEDLTEECSQAVYRCSRCHVYDYGDPGGPGYRDCRNYCMHRP